jgi:RNA polymerase sigma factor (sigma-70 family)
MSGVLRHIRDLAGGSSAEPGDAELLRRFAATQDQTAFRVLVRRHGSMVLGACRRLLGNFHDAEDAFQAVFVILARKAGSIRRPEALGAWLHEVALRTARRARVRAAIRQKHERQVPTMPDHDFLASVAWRDLQPVLDEEVQNLPVKLRVPFVLCYLEGRTYEHAAKHLCCLPGTISRRLAQARELLRSRLTRRGLALPAGVLAAALAEARGHAALTGTLVSPTIKAAVAVAAGKTSGALSAPVAALVEGGLRSMALSKAKTILTLALTIGLVCTSAGLVAERTLGKGAPQADAGKAETGDKNGAKPKPETPSAAKSSKTESAEISISCRVLAPDGKAVPSAQVMLLELPRDPAKLRSEEDFQMDLKGRTQSDADGRFQVRAPRPTGKEIVPPMIIVRANGFGLGMHGVAATDKEVVIRLPREQILRGRFVDLQGEPVKDLVVKIGAVVEKRGDSFAGAVAPAKSSTPWFKPLKTDAEGRFQVRGFGANQSVHIDVRDPRFKPARLELWKTEQQRAQEVVHVLEQAHFLQGRVTFADTGKPAAGVTVKARGSKSQTDADGRFRVNPIWHAGGPSYPGRTNVEFQPAAGSGYIGWMEFAEDSRGPGKGNKDINIALPRGVLIAGRVIDESSGKGVPRAGVSYLLKQKLPQKPITGWPAIGLVHPVTTGMDGKFSVLALEGQGHLVIKAAEASYIPVVVSLNQLTFGDPGGQRLYAHAVVPVDATATAPAKDVMVSLRRGLTVKGKLLNPDGRPARGAQIVSRLVSTTALWMGFIEIRGMPVAADFTLDGCDPDTELPVIFFDEKQNCGSIVHVSGKQASKPLEVRMQPCATAKVRFVTREGQPVQGHWGNVEMMLTPGPSWMTPAARKELAADSVGLANIYRGSYQLANFRSDGQGRLTLPGLIPGVRYRLNNRDFTARAGEVLDLKDVVVQR